MTVLFLETTNYPESAYVATHGRVCDSTLSNSRDFLLGGAP